MLVKKYKLILKNGKAFPKLFDTVKDAIASAGTEGILKLEEVNHKEDVSDEKIDTRIFAIVSRETNAEVVKSDSSGYAVTVNRPALTRVYQNMPLIEVGEDFVVESTLTTIGRYDRRLHKVWDGDGKDWEWVLYHTRGKKLTIDEAKKKYGNFDEQLGRDGAISYGMKTRA